MTTGRLLALTMLIAAASCRSGERGESTTTRRDRLDTSTETAEAAASLPGTAAPPSATSGASPVTTRPDPRPGDRYPLVIPDPRSATLESIQAQARMLVQRFEPVVVLIAIRVEPVTGEGTLDLTRKFFLGIEYGYRYLDPSEPPGKDVVEASFHVKVVKDCDPEPRPCLSVFSRPKPTKMRRKFPRPESKCTLAQVWQAAVSSGVPKNAVATGRYEGLDGHSHPWRFTIDGHDELTRDIDFECRVVPIRAMVKRPLILP